MTIAAGLIFAGTARHDQQKSKSHLLLFSKTDGYRHSSIPDGIRAIKELGNKHGLLLHETEDADFFNNNTLALYDAVIFLNTSEDVLNNSQQEALKRYIQRGGGFVGIHAAADTEYDWPWYGQMVGAYFKSHPKIQQATVQVINKNHPSTRHLPESWVRTDEWYNYKNIQPDINVLARLDEDTYRGGENGEIHPIAWYKEFQGGRVFYTGGGHTSESYSERLFRQHLLGGIQYAAGIKDAEKITGGRKY